PAASGRRSRLAPRAVALASGASPRPIGLSPLPPSLCMSCRSSFALLATLALAIMTSPSLAQPPVAAPDAGVAPPAEAPVDGGVAPDAPTQPAEEQAPVEEPAPPTAEITADDAVDDGVDDDALMDELAEELTLDDAADESAPAPNA